MRVAFGGSFNPITLAHERIIEILSKRFDEVIIVPNGREYHRKKLVNDVHRLKMLELIASKFNNVSVSDIEIIRPFKGTYQTLKDLNHPLFAIGDDCLEDLKTWMDFEKLINENSFLVFTRNKSIKEIKDIIKNDNVLKKYSNKFEIIEINYEEFSSSDYRKTKNSKYLSKEINHYIKENKLYQEVGMFNNNYLKVALATPKVYLGKPLLNAKEIIQIKNSYSNASIIVYPELSLTGYSIGDYLFNAELLKTSKEALKMIKDASDEKVLIVGFPFEYAGAIYNASAVIQNKKILGIIPKVNLPRTGEFAETRYFTSGNKIVKNPTKVNLFGENVDFGSLLFKNHEHNICFGVEICGDIWGQSNPNQELYQKGADIVFNISASTFYLGKSDIRRTLVKTVSSKFAGAYIYVSNGPSDSTSDITFSGHQIASVCGELVLDSESFSLDTVVNYIDIDLEYIRFARYSDGYARDSKVVEQNFIPFELNESESYNLEKLPDLDPFVPKTASEFEEIINVTCVSLKHRLDHIGIDKVVLGISGGLDSTLALLFAYSTYKKYGIDPKNIYAITMPGLGTGSKSKNIAKNLMEKLGVTKAEVSIKKEAIQHLRLLGKDTNDKNVTYENVQARIRTMYLMNLANEVGGIVLGTGDMSEIALGWSTFSGDHISMYSLNSGLPKTTIKALVKYYINIFPDLKSELNKVYNAIITPELTGSDQATEDKIGKYQINDFLMYHMFARGASKARIVYLITQCFKLEEGSATKYYDNFVQRFNRNQFKRLTGAEGIKIFKLTLSPRGDFKYPGDMK